MSIRIAGRVAAASFVLAATTAPAQDKADSKVYETARSPTTPWRPTTMFTGLRKLQLLEQPQGRQRHRLRLRQGRHPGQVAHAGPESRWQEFRRAVPNGLVLDLVPQGDVLLVSDRAGKYHKTFEWQ